VMTPTTTRMSRGELVLNGRGVPADSHAGMGRSFFTADKL
jgi:hypothetical protein